MDAALTISRGNLARQRQLEHEVQHLVVESPLKVDQAPATL